MSIDENLNNYRQAKRMLQEIIDKGVKTKKELLSELTEDLKN
jgi:hypothetical protein